MFENLRIGLKNALKYYHTRYKNQRSNINKQASYIQNCKLLNN